MIRSLFTGISGLRTHQTMMDVTGNNIANVNTAGFKTSSTVFQDTLSQAVRNAGAPQEGRGGTNPAQVGLGVQLASISTNFGQGGAQTTGRSTDLMIQGDGFFVVNQGGQQLYTRSGSFSFDALGQLTNATGGKLRGWSAGADGTVTTNTPPADLQLPLNGLVDPKATTEIVTDGNLPAGPYDAANPVRVPFSSPVYDALGNRTDLNLVLERANPGAGGPAWTVNTVAADGTLTATGTTVVFSADGSTVASGGTYTANGVTVDFTGLTGYAGQNTFGVESQDGAAAGSLQSFSISPTGEVVGVFSNGVRATLARVAMASFTNPGGLEKVGESNFRETGNSGIAQVGMAASGQRGSMQAGSLEMSNVDLAQEFTNLIIAQRGFQANSRVITSSDELLQDLVNLKR